MARVSLAEPAGGWLEEDICERTDPEVEIERQGPTKVLRHIPERQDDRQRGISISEVHAGGLAEKGDMAHDIENVIDHLEREAHVVTELGKRFEL